MYVHVHVITDTSTHSLGVFEWVETLCKVGRCRAETCDHDSACIAPQGVFQETSDFGVSIGNVGGLFLSAPQSTNDIAQG